MSPFFERNNIMKKYNTILFDLDGTLTDPGLGITNSVMYVLKKYGIDVPDRSELYKFIGPPLAESFEKYYGFSKEVSYKAVDCYREYYRDRGLYENTVYDGIENLLKELNEKGKTLIVATSKPEVFAKEVLRHFGLDKYFKYIAGGNLDGTRTVKAEVIAYALETCGITDKEDAVMVGDRMHDIIGAKTVRIDSMGVLFGYGSREELENAGADFIAEGVSDVLKYV